jgi:N-acetylglutamate synthase-like GNAT family acetyltransferase
MSSQPEAGFHLRPARSTDRTAIYRMVFSEHLNPMGIDWRRFLLAVDGNGRVIGCAQVKPHGDGTRELASLVVLKLYRRMGLAGRLIKTLQAESQPPLYLTCRSSLVPLYESFGFRLLDDPDLTPYFRRLKGFVRLLLPLMRSSEGLAVMIWDGR